MAATNVDFRRNTAAEGSGTTRYSAGAIGVLGGMQVNLFGLVHGPISSLNLAAGDAHQDITLRLMESAMFQSTKVQIRRRE